jgi:hypothetical protein
MQQDGRLASPPTLVLFYHVEKAGGTTVSHWLKRNVWPEERLSRRLDGHVIWQAAPCFMCTQFRELGCNRVCGKYELQRLHGAARRLPVGGWRSARLAVEFHSVSKQFFLRYVLPKLEMLRRLFRAVNGTLVTATLLREPLSFTTSVFRWQPPMTWSMPHRLTMPFERWVEQTIGAQAGLLALRRAHKNSGWELATRFQPAGVGMHNPSGCLVLEDAKYTLQSFDIVGVTACLRSFLFALGRQLDSPAAADSEAAAWIRMSSTRRRKQWQTAPQTRPQQQQKALVATATTTVASRGARVARGFASSQDHHNPATRVLIHHSPASIGSERGTLLYNQSRRSIDALNATGWGRLRELLRCDRALYEIAEKRASCEAER